MNRSWATIDASHQVLAVTRTVTSLNRILDVLPALADDPRLQVWFTVDEGSEFSVGVAERVQAMGARTVPWGEAATMSFDLIVAASDNSDLHRLAGPLLLVPHGAGYQKYSPYSDTSAGTARELSGLAATALWHDGRPVPARIGLSHDNQLAQLKAAAPMLVDRAVVIGDPCLDRLTLLNRDRGRVRQRLGLRPGQSLIAVTSTWGRESALGRWPSLPRDLIAGLPHDEFRVAAILHPNIWAYHGSWQVRHWLSRARAAGLILIPPTGPWQSVLAASDCVVGDHGSLSAYAAGLRCPLLLAAFGDAEVPPGTAMSELGKRIPRLVRQRPLTDQISRAIGTVDRELLDQLADQVFAYRGQSQARLRAVMYELLGLTLPDWSPTPAMLPQIEPIASVRPLAFRVRVEFADPDAGDTVAILRRYPATLSDPARPLEGSHLVATASDPDERLAQNAAAVVADHLTTDEAVRAWATATLAELPGCRIAAAVTEDGAVVAMLRDGRLLRVHAVDAECDPHLLASALYCQLMRHPHLPDLPTLVIAAGPSVITADFRLL
jgi:hypothetical protein